MKTPKALAAVKKPVKELAWSFSRYTNYTECPFKFKLETLERRKTPQHPAALRGGEVHKAADDFVSGLVKRMSPDLVKFKKDFQLLRRLEAQCEQEWAFNNRWERVDWWAGDAWLRMKVDAHYLAVAKQGRNLRQTTVIVIDYKTGKVREEEHALQRSLYALGAQLIYPDAAAVQVEHWYLDAEHSASDTFRSTDLAKLQKDWLERIRPLMNDKKFAPRPGFYCRYCYFRKSNGGPCKF